MALCPLTARLLPFEQTGKYYMNGYALTVQNLGGTRGYRLINWTTLGTATTFAARIVNNITWPWADSGNTQDFGTGVAIAAVRPEVRKRFSLEQN